MIFCTWHYYSNKRVTHYEACVVNGLRFHTKQREKGKKTQNSGVVVKVEEESRFQNYYGLLTDIKFNKITWETINGVI